MLIIGAQEGSWVGKTLEDLTQERNEDPIEVALDVILKGNAGVASFNMKDEDVVNFMQQPWVVTGSDGSSGHPRKYGSFPQKFQEFVMEKKAITVQDFIRRSSGLTADILNIKNRGYLQDGYKADIVVFDAELFRPEADFRFPRKLSNGVVELIINGKRVISGGEYQGVLAGVGVRNR